MATYSITLTVGANVLTKTITPDDAVAVQFFDDLIAFHFTDEVDDGDGGIRPRTRDEVADLLLTKQMQGLHGLKKRVEQMRLDTTKIQATDLEGN